MARPPYFALKHDTAFVWWSKAPLPSIQYPSSHHPQIQPYKTPESRPHRRCLNAPVPFDYRFKRILIDTYTLTPTLGSTIKNTLGSSSTLLHLPTAYIYFILDSDPPPLATMTSKFTEILEPTQAPTYTHPHLNVSLEDILAEEGRRRSASESSTSSQTRSPAPEGDNPKSPTEESKAASLRRRAFTFGSKKGRRGT